MGGIIKGLMILGIFFIGFGCYFIIMAIASTNWDQVDGKIIKTSIPARISNAGSTTQRHLEYSVELTYEYQVDGVTYNNTRYSLGDGDSVKSRFNERSEARQWLADSDYGLNEKVTVYVKPGNPTETVLSAGINIGTMIPIIFGLLLLGLGLGLKYIFSFEPKKV